MVYKILSETGPDWIPQGVPNMDIQIIPISLNLGYSSLTHSSANEGTNYFPFTDAYLSNEYSKTGYSYIQRYCDGNIVQNQTGSPSYPMTTTPSRSYPMTTTPSPSYPMTTTTSLPSSTLY